MGMNTARAVAQEEDFVERVNTVRAWIDQHFMSGRFDLFATLRRKAHEALDLTIEGKIEAAHVPFAAIGCRNSGLLKQKIDELDLFPKK